jgi:hypothetical protein
MHPSLNVHAAHTCVLTQVADFSMREELVLKIAILAEKFAPSVQWWVELERWAPGCTAGQCCVEGGDGGKGAGCAVAEVSPQGTMLS